jgi:hypothetical protein
MIPTCFEHRSAYLQEDNCIFTVSDIVTLCMLPYSAPLLIGALYGSIQCETIPDTVNIQIVLLKMSTAMLETC